MAKFVVLLFVAFLYNVSTLPINMVDEFKTKLDKVRDEAINSVNTLNLDNVETRRAIVSHSSEFAHRLQETINTIFRIFVRIDERYSHRILPQIALHLNDMVHEIQEVLISKPTILRRTLKENVNKVSEEVTKLMEVLQHLTENSDEGRLKQDVEDN
ncbi:hypothetical protein FQR65_LT11058 [Abscondita terminalis]|nr:hypothetical protein FQR65_LT11058 [Abscondita terminalis]